MGDYAAHKILVEFLSHLRMVYILMIVTLIAWKWRIIGGAAFMGMGGYYAYTMLGTFPPFVSSFIVGPLLLIGLLFILGRVAMQSHSPNRETKVAFWTLALTVAIFLLSEIIIYMNSRSFEPIYAGIVVLAGVAAGLYGVNFTSKRNVKESREGTGESI